MNRIAPFLFCGLFLAACAQTLSPEEPALERALGQLDLSQKEFDREQCSASHGANNRTLQQCLEQRDGARKAQLDDLREALRERLLRTGETSCSNPITGVTGLCQEI